MNDKAKQDSNSNSNLKNSPNLSRKVIPKVRTIQVLESKVSENKGGECRDETKSQTDDKKEDKVLENMTRETAKFKLTIT